MVGPDVWIARESTFTHAHQRMVEAPAQPCLKEA
jgi:hypothetical protein